MLRFKAKTLASLKNLARLSLLFLPIFILPACISDQGFLAFFSDKTTPRSSQPEPQQAQGAQEIAVTAAAAPLEAKEISADSTVSADVLNSIIIDDRTKPQEIIEPTQPEPAPNQSPTVQTAQLEVQIVPQPLILSERTVTPQETETDSETLETLETLETTQTLYSAEETHRELINFSTVVQGLTGRLTTGSAGTDFLAKYGRLPQRSTLNMGEKLAALDYDNAPRSNRFLRMGQGVTNRLLVSAYSQTGRPYQSGGKSPKTGFDDAGFTAWLFGQEGIRLPSQAKDQVAAGHAVAKDELRPGDLLVYKMPKGSGFTVGLYSGNGNFILASQRHKGITEAAAFDTEYGPYFIGGRRFLDDPKASPLSDEVKTQATNGAVKLALSELGDNIPKPSNIYGGPAKKTKSKSYYKKSKTSRRGTKAKAVSRRVTAKKVSKGRSQK